MKIRTTEKRKITSTYVVAITYNTYLHLYALDVKMIDDNDDITKRRRKRKRFLIASNYPQLAWTCLLGYSSKGSPYIARRAAVVAGAQTGSRK